MWRGNRQRTSWTGCPAPAHNHKPAAGSAVTGLWSGPGLGAGALGPTKPVSKPTSWSGGASVFQGCLEVSNHGALVPLPSPLPSLQDDFSTLVQAGSKNQASPLPHCLTAPLEAAAQPQGQDVGRNWRGGEPAPCAESGP